MKKTRHTYLTVRCEVTILPACDCSTMPGPIRGHRKNRRGRGGGTKNHDLVGGKNMASGRGTTSRDREREGVGRGNF